MHTQLSREMASPAAPDSNESGNLQENAMQHQWALEALCRILKGDRTLIVARFQKKFKEPKQ